jgi:hypothetical protein
MMLTVAEINALCADIASETLSELTEIQYQEMLDAQLAEAQILEYAAQSYDNDAIEYGVTL